VRVDDGIIEGGEVSVHYDPMVAKLITRAPTRESARLVMLQALDRYAIRGSGLRHNINFLRTLMDHPRFVDGKLTTAFIPDEFPDGYAGHELTSAQHEDVLSCAAALQYAYAARRSSAAGASTAPASLRVGVEGSGDEHDLIVRVAGGAPAGTASTIAGAAVAPGTILQIDGVAAATDAAAAWSRTVRLDSTGLGPDATIEARFLTPGGLDAPDAAGRPLAVQVVERTPLGWALSAFGSTYDVLARSVAFAELAVHMKPPPRSALDGALLSPMPGTLISVNVEEGESVFIGQQLCVVEAMKMQNVLHATRDGTVSALMALPGSTLAADQPIIAFEVEVDA